MNRRDFMKGILAAGMAPAIVQAENIMRINPRIWTPPSVGFDAAGWGDTAMLALVDAQGRLLSDPVKIPAGKYGRISLSGLDIDVTKTGVIESMRLRMPGFKSIDIPMNTTTKHVMESMQVQLVGDLEIS